MKRLIGVVIFCSLVMSISCANLRQDTPTVYVPNENCKQVSFKPGLEPEGFNGIKWETNLLTLKGMKLHRKDPSHGGIEFYLKEGDTFKLKNGKNTSVQYGFWRGRFYVGMVATQGLSDWNALKETVFNKFGEGAKPFSNKEEYLWVGKNAVMALRYNEISNGAIFYIRSDSMTKQMDD